VHPRTGSHEDLMFSFVTAILRGEKKKKEQKKKNRKGEEKNIGWGSRKEKRPKRVMHEKKRGPEET